MTVPRLQTCTGDENYIINIKGDQGSAWQQAALEIPPTSKPYRIIFKAAQGTGVLGDTAIDDIEFSSGKCQSIYIIS